MKTTLFNNRFFGILLAAPLLLGSSLPGAGGEKARDSGPALLADDAQAPRHPFAVADRQEEPPSPPGVRPPAPPKFKGRPPAPPEGAADEPPPPQPEKEERRGHRRGMDGADDMAMLDRLLAMPPEQLSRVRQALERIEAMEPEEREALRQRLRDFRSISPEKRQEMREQWRDMSPEERREHIREMRERRWEKVLEEKEQEEDEETPPEDD